MPNPVRIRQKSYAPPTLFIPTEEMSKAQRFHYEQIEDPTHIDPSEQFDRAVEALAEIYGCSESEVTRSILRNL